MFTASRFCVFGFFHGLFLGYRDILLLQKDAVKTHPFSFSYAFLKSAVTKPSYFEILRMPFWFSLRNRLAAPEFAVEAAILDGFGHMSGLHIVGAAEIGDGSRHFEEAIVGTGGEAELLNGGTEQRFYLRAKGAVGAQFTRAHLGVAVDASGRGFGGRQPLLSGGVRVIRQGLGETLGLDLACTANALANDFGAFSGVGGKQLLFGEAGHLHMEVNAVEQGAGDSFKVLLHAAGLAGALAKDVAEIAAGAGVHGGNEGEIGGIGVGGVDTGYLHNAIFERLTQHLQGISCKLRQLVEEKNPMVCEAYFAWAGDGAASHKGRGRDRMVRRTKGACIDERHLGGEKAGYGVEFGNFEGLIYGERGQDGGKATRHHGFAAAGGADEQNVVTAGGGDFQSAFYVPVAFYIGEIVDKLWGIRMEKCGIVGHRGDPFGHGEGEGHFMKVGDGIDGDIGHNGGLTGVLFGHIETLTAVCSRPDGCGKHAAYGAYVAVERKLSYNLGAFNMVCRKLPCGHEKPYGNRQVEAGAGFADVGGGKIDGHTFIVGKLEAGVFQGGAHPLFALIDGGIGQTDDGGGGHSGAYIHFHIDFVGINAEDGAREHSGQHVGQLLVVKNRVSILFSLYRILPSVENFFALVMTTSLQWVGCRLLVP